MSSRLERGPDGVDLVVTGSWSRDDRATVERGDADGLVLNYALGFTGSDVSFVHGLPLRRLTILDRSLTDLTPVHSLGGTLEVLSVQSDPRATIELEQLPGLRRLSASWSQVQGSIRYLPHLEHLFLGSYTEADLTPLASLTSLSRIDLKDLPRVRSLDGAEELPWLAHLGVHLGKRLTDISALARAGSPVLTELLLPSCRKVTGLEPVAACSALRVLDLSEGAEIPTVAPLVDLTDLERLHLYGSTKVTDLDLGPIARLPRLTDFRMQNRRGYSPSVKDIQTQIAQRA